MRAVIEHGLDRGRCPSNSATPGPFFRYERPQAGRYRQLQQVGVEAIGVDDPALDAEVIAIADAGFRSLGLDGFAWKSPPLATTAADRGTGNCRTSCFGLDLDEGHPRAAELNRCGCSTISGRIFELTARAPLMLDHLSGEAKGRLTPSWRTWMRCRCPTSSILGWCAVWTTTPRPPSSSFMTVSRPIRHRRRRPLRRIDGPAGRPGSVRHRFRARRGPHHAGASGRGQRGRRPRALRGSVSVGERAKIELADWPAALRTAGVRWTSPMETAVKGAMRAADRSGRVSLWWPATGTSTPELSVSGSEHR